MQGAPTESVLKKEITVVKSDVQSVEKDLSKKVGDAERERVLMKEPMLSLSVPRSF